MAASGVERRLKRVVASAVRRCYPSSLYLADGAVDAIAESVLAELRQAGLTVAERDRG